MKDDFMSDEAKDVTNLGWDKFMDDIVKREDDAREAQKEYARVHGAHPARKLARLYRETPHNRMKIIGKK
jgi:hypothetical protein